MRLSAESQLAPYLLITLDGALIDDVYYADEEGGFLLKYDGMELPSGHMANSSRRLEGRVEILLHDAVPHHLYLMYMRKRIHEAPRRAGVRR